MAGFALLALVFVALAGRVQLPSQAPHELPRDVLAHRAKEMLASFGVAPETSAGRAQGFSHDRDVTRWLESDQVPTGDRWRLVQAGRPAPLRYWYRQSPRDLMPLINQPKVVSWGDPSTDTSGMASIRLDTAGRLLDYLHVPPQLPANPSANPAEPDWNVLFTAAGLDPAGFQEAEPNWLPPFFADQRAAWTGELAELPRVELRVEAAAFQGNPVYFRLIGPWSRAERQVDFRPSASARFSQILGMSLFLLVLLTSAWSARRNLLAGRGDRRGAFRVAIFILTLNVVIWLLIGSHVRSFPRELALLVLSLTFALFYGAIVWLLYMALEPSVRRQYPHWLISWSRLLAGRFRDPLIARDVLVGAALGAVVATAGVLFPLLDRTVGAGTRLPEQTHLAPLTGLRQALGTLLNDLPGAIFGGMLVLFLWFLFQRLLRSQWLTGTVLVVVLASSVFGQGDLSWIGILSSLVPSVLFVLALVRFGLLTLIAALIFSIGISNLPISLDSSAWWSQASWINLALIAALAIWAFRGAYGGRRPVVE